MLFRTVYGPELEAVYSWIEEFGPINQGKLFQAFGSVTSGKQSSTSNLEDALHFLESARLIKKSRDKWKHTISTSDFRLSLIKNLRSIQNARKETAHPLDSYFMKIAEQLFIQPDTLFQRELHQRINKLELPIPIGEEKVNAWKRVIEFLGVGNRGFGGIWIQYQADLVKRIIDDWPEEEAPMQHFLERHFSKYLPWMTTKGEIATAVSRPLEALEGLGHIQMTAKQDLPNKSYFGARKVKWIKKV